MTIKEVYEDAVAKGAEDYEIQLQYQDCGGYYDETGAASEVEYDEAKKQIILG